MADKKLLEESTIRRFMQLANIKSEQTGVLTESAKSPVTKGKGVVSKGNKRFGAGEGKHRAKVHESYVEEEYMNEEDYMEEEDPMGGVDAGSDMTGGMDGAADSDGFGDDEMGGEGDTKTKVEDAVETLKNALNDILDAVGSDKQVEDDGGDTGMEEPDMEEPDMEEPEGEEDAGGDEELDEQGMYSEEDDMHMQKEGTNPFADKNKENKNGKNSPTTNGAKKGGKNPPKKETMEEELDESFELVDDDLVERLLQRVTDRLVREARTLKESKSSGGSKSHKPKGTTYKPHGPGKATPFKGSGKTLGHSGPHKAKK